MPIELWQGLLIPFAGTTLGAACVFFMRNNLGEMVQRALTGFAAGVMVAASIWSLLLPAMEQAADMGRWSFVPAVVGFWLGIFFLLGLDRLIPHLHRGSAEAAMSVCRVWYFVRKKMVNGSRGTAFGFNGTGNLARKRQSIA